MKLHNDVWYPDDEIDPVLLAGAKRYQGVKLDIAMEHVKGRNLAIDIGANCGLWSLQMALLFKRVVAFEPVSKSIECFKKNAEGVELHEIALGDRRGTCGMLTTDKFSCQSYVEEIGNIPMMRLDDFDLVPDFIKIDCEGYEYFVLKGAEKTIKTWRPTIIVEQKPGNAARYGLPDTLGIDYLKELGMSIKRTIVGDYVMAF